MKRNRKSRFEIGFMPHVRTMVRSRAPEQDAGGGEDPANQQVSQQGSTGTGTTPPDYKALYEQTKALLATADQRYVGLQRTVSQKDGQITDLSGQVTKLTGDLNTMTTTHGEIKNQYEEVSGKLKKISPDYERLRLIADKFPDLIGVETKGHLPQTPFTQAGEIDLPQLESLLSGFRDYVNTLTGTSQRQQRTGEITDPPPAEKVKGISDAKALLAQANTAASQQNWPEYNRLYDLYVKAEGS